MLPGGFVGVDVFFVISGFLITSQILHGGLSIGAFWVRRARRILPASMFVLLACTVATEAFVPTVHWDQFLTDIRWSALYAQNAHLAGSAVDYFAAADAPSPVHHYWSLSVEEQFYAVWPVLLLLGRRAAAVAVVIAAATLLSLAWSIHTTAANPAPAFFATPGRAWEFGAGALLATRGSPTARPWLGWAGLAAIAAAAALYGPGTPFPGVAGALPVLGAAAVIAARCAPPRRLLASATVQFTGDISYGIYLWHWPLLVVAPYALPAPRGAQLVLTLVLAALGKRLIEAPLRRGPLLARPTWTFAGAALATSAVIAASALGSHRLQREIRTADREEHAVLAAHPRCFGAAARDRQRPCDDSRLRLTVIPTPAQAAVRPNSP